MPISLHLTGDPLPQVRAMPSGVGRGPHLTGSPGMCQRPLGTGRGVPSSLGRGCRRVTGSRRRRKRWEAGERKEGGVSPRRKSGRTRRWALLPYSGPASTTNASP